MFGSQKFLGQKDFLLKKILGSKNIWGKKIWGKKNFGQKELGQKFFLSKETQVGLTQGGGYMTPPPENSRVKIVLGCC